MSQFSFTEDFNNPDLFEQNKAGEYEYGVNEGAPYARGSLVLKSAERSPKNQKEAGGDYRRDQSSLYGVDDGGHLIGARFGGSGDQENLTAQDRNLNRGEYKKLENEWERHLGQGDKVFVHIETDNGNRPNAYMGYVIYESADGSRTSDFFHFVNESRSEQDNWETVESQNFDYSQMESGITVSTDSKEFLPQGVMNDNTQNEDSVSGKNMDNTTHEENARTFSFGM